MFEFDLLSSPWIPVGRGGCPADVSLTDALTHAHEIDGITVSHAVQGPPLLRLLIAVVLDACGPPRDHRDLSDRWAAGRFPEATLRAYLARPDVVDRFDLFSDQRPFAQVAGLHTSDNKTKPSSLLIPAAPSGNNVPLFASRTEADPVPLTAAEAARWLLSTHAWDTAAIKSGAVGDPQMKAGKTTGNPTGPLGQLGVAFPVGQSLFETLLLNLPWRQDGADLLDVPHWRREAPIVPAWSKRQPTGVVELLTWQSRRIRLVPTESSDGVVVERVVVAAGDRLEFTPEYEPHTTWNLAKVKESGDVPMRPRRHQSGHAAWRGLPALLALEPDAASSVQTSVLVHQLAQLENLGSVLDDEYLLQMHIVGVEFGNQSAVVENVIADQIPFPLAALRADLEVRILLGEIAVQSKALHDAANMLHADLRRAGGGAPVPWDKSQRPGELVLHLLDGHVRRILAGFQRDVVDEDLVSDARLAWQRAARRSAVDVVEPLLRTAPPQTFAGRPISPDNVEKRVTAGTAESRFRYLVNEALPLSRPVPRPLSGSHDEVA